MQSRPQVRATACHFPLFPHPSTLELRSIVPGFGPSRLEKDPKETLMTFTRKTKYATRVLGLISVISLLLFAATANAAGIPAGTHVTVRMGHQMSSETA